MKTRYIAFTGLSALLLVGCITEADRMEYAQWKTSDDAPRVVQSISIDEFLSKYKEGWRERAAEKMAARLAREALEREYAEWKASDDAPKTGETVSVEDFAVKYKEGWRERAEEKKAARLAREALEREYAEWKASDDAPKTGETVSVEDFAVKYKEGWRERATEKKAARLAREALELECAEWMASDDAPRPDETVSLDEFVAKYKEGWRERAAEKMAARLAREALEREYAEWKASDDAPKTGQTVSVDDFATKYKDGWRERVAEKKAARLAREELARSKARKIGALVENSLKDIRESYSRQKPYKCAFPRENAKNVDWLTVWVDPRRELSDADKLAGEAILEEFGVTYLPQAYAAYEKLRDTAREIQQVYNEEFPQAWTIDSSSPKWGPFNKVLEKFAKARTAYFWAHDELCELWIEWKFGLLTAENLVEMDSGNVGVVVCGENSKLEEFQERNIGDVKESLVAFSQQYAPESYAIYQQLTKEFTELKATISEVQNCCCKMDMSRFSYTMRSAIFKRDQMASRIDTLAHNLEELRMSHRIMDKTADEVASLDREIAMGLKPFLESAPQMIKIGWEQEMFKMANIPGRTYRMQTTEVTQSQWFYIMGTNPSRFKGESRPVENVSWKDCHEFIKRLNVMSATQYRLPTADEWKYACRAGSTGDYCKLADGTMVTEKTLGDVAWYEENSKRETHPVGLKKPNAFGLFDMHGNVWEWTDTADDGYLVYCGGSWESSSWNCISSSRERAALFRQRYDFGFRLCADGRAE